MSVPPWITHVPSVASLLDVLRQPASRKLQTRPTRPSDQATKPDMLAITHHERQAIAQPESQDPRLQMSDGYDVDSSQGSLVRHRPNPRHETRDTNHRLPCRIDRCTTPTRFLACRKAPNHLLAFDPPHACGPRSFLYTRLYRRVCRISDHVFRRGKRTPIQLRWAANSRYFPRQEKPPFHRHQIHNSREDRLPLKAYCRTGQHPSRIR